MNLTRLRAALRRPFVGPLVALAAVYGLFAALSPDTFARPATLVNMARQTAVVGVAACGMTLVIILGGIDLAVGSTVALTTVIVAALLKAGAGPGAAVLAGVAVAAATGVASGGLIAGLRVAPFIVTLGAMRVLRGVAKGLAHEQKIDVDAHGLDALIRLPHGAASALFFPPSVWILAAVGVATATLLSRTRFGRHVVAVGSNEETARLCGVDVTRVKIAVYALSAALAGLAGVIEFGTLTVGDPTDSLGLELDVIASVVIGGGSLSGGEGSVVGAILGALLMTVIRTGCVHLGVPNWVQDVITGGILVTAATVDRLRARRG
jgi:ribose transport system permease protein